MIRPNVLVFALALLVAAPALAQPPRDELPAPRELVESVGAGSTDAEVAAVAAAAARYPLGTTQNPVRVGGPEGARAYIGRLRCADGQAPTVGTEAPGGAGAYGTIVATYPLNCSGTPSTLVVDLYHDGHVETAAPAGFTVAR